MIKCTREAAARNLSLYDESDFAAYARVQARIQEIVQQEFKPNRDMHLTNPTFFSRLSAAAPVTEHDHYWHTHVDKTTYGTVMPGAWQGNS